MSLVNAQRLLERGGWRRTHRRGGVAVWQKVGGNVAVFLSPTATFRTVMRVLDALADSD